eukprot:1490552-Rhodomonas_salina.1
MATAVGGDLEGVAKLLVEKSADVNAQNNYVRRASVRDGDRAGCRENADITPDSEDRGLEVGREEERKRFSLVFLIEFRGRDEWCGLDCMLLPSFSMLARYPVIPARYPDAIRGWQGFTPLLRACQSRCEGAAKLLVENSASIHTTSKDVRDRNRNRNRETEREGKGGRWRTE